MTLERRQVIWALLVTLSSFFLLGTAQPLTADDPSTAADPSRGYTLLLNKAYVPRYFDQQVFDQVWQVWPEPLRSTAEKATSEQRRELAFARYGLTSRPGDNTGLPLQFVVDHEGNWTPNCFFCHGGSVSGAPYPGAPNAQLAMQTLIKETRATKLRLGKPFDPVDFGSLLMPLGTTRGTTNAVIFGVILAAFRDHDLNILPGIPRPQVTHHDMDAPPWWYFQKKQTLYADGFAEKGHRGLMQFAMDRSNGPEKFRAWEDDFRHIFAYMESLTPPPYPATVKPDLAGRGRLIFEQTCAECHGTYGEPPEYPNRIVPIEEIGTDRVRYDALTREHRQSYRDNWFSQYGKEKVLVNTPGYLAPPLDGIWASAPYFHNGSVPTLWHVLHPQERPTVWKRQTQQSAFDEQHVGLRIDELSPRPAGTNRASASPEIFDTRRPGKSAQGHRFPEQLSESERAAVLEYLKTL